MIKTLIILILFTLFKFNTEAHTGDSFVLKGKNLYEPGEECFLYVNNFGYDESLPGKNKFFAIVTTSYQPSKIIPIVPHSRLRFQMVSIDRSGRPTKELEIRLRGEASEQTLYRALAYQSAIRLPGNHPWRLIACTMLHPAQ